MTKLNIQIYTKELQKRLAGDFDCGNPYINEFIKSPVSLDNSYGKTYVYLSDDNNFLIGFYNLGVGYIDYLKDNQRYKAGGAIHINEFALHSKFHSTLITYDNNGQKINLSDILLYDCLHRIKEIRENFLGYAFVTLCSTEEEYSLYSRRDFQEIGDDYGFSVELSEKKCKKMYLWLDENDIV